MIKNINKKIVYSVLTLMFLGFASQVNAQTLTTLVNTLDTTLSIALLSIVTIGWSITAFLYLTAAGNPTKIATAKMSLIACVIGTVLASLAIWGGITNVIEDAFGL